MPRKTIRDLLNATGVSYSFVDGVSVVGVNLDAPLPMVDDVPPPTNITPEMVRVALVSIAADLKQCFRIGAIKTLRGLTNLGLKEAKDVIDLFGYRYNGKWTHRDDAPQW